jgi:hypothetical protein
MARFYCDEGEWKKRVVRIESVNKQSFETFPKVSAKFSSPDFVFGYFLLGYSILTLFYAADRLVENVKLNRGYCNTPSDKKQP